MVRGRTERRAVWQEEEEEEEEERRTVIRRESAEMEADVGVEDRKSERRQMGCRRRGGRCR
jgi:hypothetical protein